MRPRFKDEKRMKIIVIRSTVAEHAYVKIKAAERGLTMTALMLESLRCYLRESK